MRILYHFRTRGTGAEGVHIAGIARAFEKLGHTVEFSSPTGVDPRKSAGDDPFAKAGRSWFWTAFSQLAPRFLFELIEIGYNAAAWRRNRRLLNRERYDLIYERHAFFLVATAWLAGRRQLPLVVEVNELVGDQRIREQPFLSGFARWCDRFCFRYASLIVVVSPHLKRRIEGLGIDGTKILVLPNAVDEEKYRERAKDRGSSIECSGFSVQEETTRSERSTFNVQRATPGDSVSDPQLSAFNPHPSASVTRPAEHRLPIRDHHPSPSAVHNTAALSPAGARPIVIGFVGWLVAWHRLEDLVDAFAELVRAHEDSEAAVSGGGAVPDAEAGKQAKNEGRRASAPLSGTLCLLLVGDGPLRQSLLARAAALGVQDRLLITGAVPHAEVAGYIAGMDVAVIPHSNEFRSPIKLFEYMGQGVATVAPCTEPIAMVVRDGENGVLFAPGDRTALRDAIGRLLLDSERRRIIGDQARRDVLAKHTWRRNAEALLDALNAGAPCRTPP